MNTYSRMMESAKLGILRPVNKNTADKLGIDYSLKTTKKKSKKSLLVKTGSIRYVPCDKCKKLILIKRLEKHRCDRLNQE